MNCTRCAGTGFLNAEQIPGTIDAYNSDAVLDWIDDLSSRSDSLGGCSCHISPPCSWCLMQHDVQVCDCCGDGQGWYGTPGEHNYRQGGDEPFPGCN